jgi:hypothetical protein
MTQKEHIEPLRREPFEKDYQKAKPKSAHLIGIIETNGETQLRLELLKFNSLDEEVIDLRRWVPTKDKADPPEKKYPTHSGIYIKHKHLRPLIKLLQDTSDYLDGKVPVRAPSKTITIRCGSGANPEDKPALAYSGEKPLDPFDEEVANRIKASLGRIV